RYVFRPAAIFHRRQEGRAPMSKTILRLALSAALVLGAAACAPRAGLLGDPRGDTNPYSLCTPPAYDYTGWTTVREGAVSFKVPPGFHRAQSTGHESGAWEQTWVMGQRSIYAYATRDEEEYRNLNPRCVAEMQGRTIHMGLIRYSAMETMQLHREAYVGGRWAAAGNWDVPGPYGFRLYVTGRDDADTGELARAVMWSVEIEEPVSLRAAR
ncbi:MAG TPA: hypothetical protein VFQ39_18580, partial [Longimicrobium sp.]|nr:hypothetical protein [Longimicrobium sp.]